MRMLMIPLTLALTASLPSQNFIDTFSYPDGNTVPGWTQQAFTWKISQGRLIPTGGRSFHYITKDAFKNITDCVLDIEVIYPTVQSLHYGGVCARHPGGSGENGLVMTKLQDNSNSGNFNRAYIYERPGTNVWKDVTQPTTKHAVVRMFVQGNTGWFEIDRDLDGIFELKSGLKTFTNAATKASGLIGACGYNGAEMDNWKFYEGSMVPDPTTTPKIGTTYKMIFTAPLNGGANPRPSPWIALLSAGNKGIPLPNQAWLPLSLDVLLINSMGWGWSGVLTNTVKSGTLALTIPNMPSIVGLKLWSAGFTLGASRPGGFGAISNAHGFILTK